MAPRLRVVVSSTSKVYPPSEPITVNTSKPTVLKTPHFEGEVSVWIKNYEGDHKGGEGEEYFGREGRGDKTYAIVVKGRFKDQVDGDEVMWGNVFEKPVRDSLPWGTSIATKFMYYVDPTMEADVYADRPYALGPMIATMNYLSLDGPKQGSVAVEEHVDADDLHAEAGDGKARKKHFVTAEHRKAVSLKDRDVAMEFGNGFIDFNTLSLSLPPPFSLQIPLTKYWDGQPVTYVCQKRGTPGENVFFAIGFEIIDEELKKALKARTGGGDSSSDEAEEDGASDSDVD